MDVLPSVKSISILSPLLLYPNSISSFPLLLIDIKLSSEDNLQDSNFKNLSVLTY